MAKIWDFIKGFFKHDKPTTTTESGTIALGGNYWSATKNIPTAELITIGDFFRCVQLISDSVAEIDFNVYKFEKNNWKYDSSNIWNVLLNKTPNNELSAYEFKKIIVSNLFIYGAAYIYIYRDDRNKPIELIPIFSNYITREVVNGEPVYYLLPLEGVDPKTKKDIDKVKLPAEDVIYIPWETLDNIKNVNFKNIFSNTLNKIIENDKSTLNAFKNDTGLSLWVKLQDASNRNQRERVAQSLKETAEHLKQTGMMAFVYDDKMEIQANDKFISSPISIELRKYVAQELAAKFGIPPAYLGVEIPNQSTAQLAKYYLDRAIRPVLARIIKKIEYTIFKDITIKKDKYKIRYNTLFLEGLDAKDKIDVASRGVNGGIFTINEARDYVGLDPIDGGDTLYANGTLQPIKLLDEKVEAEIEKVNAETENIKEQEPNETKILN